VLPADATWCTLENASGTGNGTLKITVGPSSAPIIRGATVTITASGLADTVLVAQAAITEPATLCEECLWSGSTWVNGYVTTTDFTPTTEGEWSGYDNDYYPGATSDKDGRANTAAITDAKAGSAIKHCQDLGAGWYLPAYEELFNISAGSSSWGHLGNGVIPLNNRFGANLLTNDQDYLTSTEVWGETGRYNDPVTNNLSEADQKARVVKMKFSGEAFNGFKEILSVRCVWRP
jgi:hypothetical protein